MQQQYITWYRNILQPFPTLKIYGYKCLNLPKWTYYYWMKSKTLWPKAKLLYMRNGSICSIWEIALFVTMFSNFVCCIGVRMCLLEWKGKSSRPVVVRVSTLITGEYGIPLGPSPMNVLIWNAILDSTMMITRQYDDDNATVRYYDITMVKTRQYDGENATVRWWKHDNTTVRWW